MYSALLLIMLLKFLEAEAYPLHHHSLQDILPLDGIIFTREEAEDMVRESQSHGTTCDSKTIPSSGHLPVYATSLCPWYYELVHQPGLFPSHILRAKLRCNNSENRSPCKMQNSRDNSCEYIRKGIRIINETCEGQGCEFIRYIRVGAQCVQQQSGHG